jgi:hypothetical protein
LFFGLYAVLFVANGLYLVLALSKWFRDMTALAGAGATRP